MWRRRLFFGQIRSTENYEFSVNVDNYNIIMAKYQLNPYNICIFSTLHMILSQKEHFAQIAFFSFFLGIF